MERVFYELSVLSRAVAHKNLSGASRHIGLSQPQLSRIVKRIEETFSVMLLDRTAKRNATWTPEAFQLSEFYSRKMRSFDRELEALVHRSQTRQLVIGSLEGLISVALPFVHQLLESAGIKLVEIDVFDLDRLESLFSKGELDLVFTSREPGRRKFTYLRDLGYQSLDSVQSNPHFQVMSTFEHGSRRESLKNAEKVLISNSLAIRREWFQKFGGKGTLPSAPKKRQSSSLDTERIILVGADTLSRSVWEKLLKV
jgi:LysR family transcriptional regulator, transcriptional activator for aaeXAB operon